MTDNSNQPLVSQEWLSQHLGTENIKILDCSWYMPHEMRDPSIEYELEHIPQAIFFDWEKCSGPKSTESCLYLPDTDQFTLYLESLGISNDDLVVVYDAMGFHQIASRAWWMFRVFGHTNVVALNGGLTSWKTEGRQTSVEEPVHEPVKRSRASYDDRLVRHYGQMKSNIKSGTEQMIDVRPPARFLGVDSPLDRNSGHMPNAINLPVLKCLDTSSYSIHSPAEIAKIMGAVGIDVDKPTVAYCGGGGSSPVIAIALYTLGQCNVAIYDGAWSDWVSHDDALVARG